MAGKTVFLFQLPGVSNELIRCTNFSFAEFSRVAPETVGSKGYSIAHLSPENGMDRHSPGLPHDVEARELQSREQLCSIVVERSCGIRNAKPHLFQAHRVVAQKVGFQGAYCGLCRFAAAAHLTETYVAVVGLDFHDGSNKASPMAAVTVAECCMQRNGHRISADICDLHTN